jgi:hypothetical protein
LKGGDGKVGHDPYLLSVRKNDWGAGLLPVSPLFREGADPSDSADAHSKLIFFIHGYNNTISAAEHTWRTETWNKLIERGITKETQRSIVFFFWPGDISKYAIISAPSYPSQIAIAEQAADELAEYLSKLRSPTGERVKIQFIAHSLGCRLVLEALFRVQNRRLVNIEITDVLLMAAAVPVGLCMPFGDARFGRQVATTREIVLYSKNDLILKWVFRPGEWLADDLPPHGSVAVGRTGRPLDRWSKYSEECELGHSDYWTHSESLRRIHILLSPERERRMAERQLSPILANPRRELSERTMKFSLWAARDL